MPAALRVTAGILHRDGRVLIAQRPPHKNDPLCWEFPGGKVEAGESEIACLRRELQEELGVEVRVGAFLLESRAQVGSAPLILRSYLIDAFVGEPRALEHAALRWVAPEGLRGLAMPLADRPVVAALLCRGLPPQAPGDADG